ncbi:MAG: MBL fold metallo-hydrolase [Clostridiales bacterium]|jgi:hydroxyacylglutathione hydrolase|nr:MBL fold metallo-hydrolase [Clostridiales bacterium]
MVERLSFGMVNCYLIRGHGQTILVDTGTRKNRDALYEAIRDKNVKLLVLTHGHTDHIENAAFLAKNLHLPIAMHRGDFKLTQGKQLRPFQSDSFLGTLLKYGSEKVKRTAPPFRPALFLDHGQTFSSYGIDASVVELKGHTQGSLGILVDKTDFIVGDAMMNILRPSPSLIYENKRAMLHSLEVIRQSKAVTIYPGHGKPIDAKKYFKR